MECADKLELDQIKDREWQIMCVFMCFDGIVATFCALSDLLCFARFRATNALAGDGIEQGINWLADHMKK